jgi:hypothetical protein
MRKIVLAAVALSALAVATPAQAQQDIRAICNEQSCAGIPRCYYWTDYPTCIYPWPIIPR